MDRHLTQLSPELQRLLQTYVKRVGTVLGPGLEGMLLYGSALRGEHREGYSNVNVLLTLAEVDGEVLRKAAPVLVKWKKEQVVSLLLRTGEIERWAVQFPLEFGDLLDHRLLLAGRDPFVALRQNSVVSMEAVLREVRTNLVRLRQRYLEGGASNESALILIPMSITSLGSCLRGLLRAWDVAAMHKTDAVVQAACQRLSVDPAPFLEAWALRCGSISPGPLEVPRLFDRYLTGLQQLADRLPAAPVSAST